ncbi:hypothetical protein ACQEVS_26815 [Streptomyces sp. CA-181903]|uniref:hypothetical protein n=1 Tax=Streptomyces sp. CA-181903 TaxID=3240055 RepID=UPI003D942F08
MLVSTAARRHRLRSMTLAGLLTAATLGGIGTAGAEGNPTGRSDYDYTTYQNPERCADQSEEFRFRFYFNSGYGGAWTNIGHPMHDLTVMHVGGDAGDVPLRYCDKGKGAGQVVGNNSASAYNWYRGYCATVFYNSWYRGASDRIAPNNGMNLSATYNNNKSIDFEAC